MIPNVTNNVDEMRMIHFGFDVFFTHGDGYVKLALTPPPLSPLSTQRNTGSFFVTPYRIT